MNEREKQSQSDEIFELLKSLPHPVREKLFVELAIKGYFSHEATQALPWRSSRSYKKIILSPVICVE